jgi:hypothetical protein
VRDGLGVGCYRIVLLDTEVDKAGTEGAEDIFDEGESVFAGSVLDKDLNNSHGEFGSCLRRASKRTRGWPVGLTVGP